MKTIYLTMLSILIHFSYSYAQNYYHIYRNVPISSRSKLPDYLDYWANLYGIKNTTFTVMTDKLPSRVEATIDFEKAPVGNRKMILIRINKYLDPNKIIEVVAHEMVHAKQYYSQDLIRIGSVNYLWKGILYGNILQIEYSRRPWEIEAHQQAKLLL